MIVLMPVFNGERHIMSALESISSQTYQGNIEILIINDGSTDETVSILEKFSASLVGEKGRRRTVTVLSNENNRGVAASLDVGVAYVVSMRPECRYVARMDADDVCMKERLKRQVDEMELNKEIDVLGTSVEIFCDADNGMKAREGTSGQTRAATNKIIVHPKNDVDIRWSMWFYCPLAHPTIHVSCIFCAQGRAVHGGSSGRFLHRGLLAVDATCCCLRFNQCHVSKSSLTTPTIKKA